MAPRKKQANKAPVKTKPAPVKQTAKTEAPAPPKITLGELARKALQLQQQHSLNTPAAPAGPKGPKPTIVEFKITLSDGTVLHATGKHADVAFRFSNECQEICQTQGLAAYNGPPLTRYSAEEWAEKNV